MKKEGNCCIIMGGLMDLSHQVPASISMIRFTVLSSPKEWIWTRSIVSSWSQGWGRLSLSLLLIWRYRHCSGSAPTSKTPTYFGGANQGMGLGDRDVFKVQDQTHDVLSTMIKWVENKKAPEQIVATA
jgi:hypothetical protein